MSKRTELIKDRFDTLLEKWRKAFFEPGQDLQPIRGVTYNAAWSFSKWLGNRHKGLYEYWLPTSEAAAQLPLPDLATWLHNGELSELGDEVDWI